MGCAADLGRGSETEEPFGTPDLDEDEKRPEVSEALSKSRKDSPLGRPNMVLLWNHISLGSDELTNTRLTLVAPLRAFFADDMSGKVRE